MLPIPGCGAHLLVQQQSRAYAQQLQSWGTRVVGLRDLHAMAREAGLPPAPGPLIRALSSLTGPDKRRAEGRIERALLDRVKEETDSALLRRIRPLVQGHYPRVATAVDARIALLN